MTLTTSCRGFLTVLSGFLLCGAALFFASPAFALDPGDVAGHSGGVNFSGNIIDLANRRSSIDWHRFNIPNGQTINFQFQQNGSAALNRVTGNTASSIMGNLNANGAVYLVNPNGIVIGSSANINAHAFVGSTLNVNDAQRNNFLNGQSVEFARVGNTNAAMVNQGNINATTGSVVLLGTSVSNSGTITAPNGSVEMLAGSRISATLADPSRPAFTVHTTVDTIGGTGISNTGMIDAVSARLEAVGGNVYALAINNAGLIRANAIVNENGRIKLVSNGGTIRNSGSLQANANDVNADAGRIELVAANIEMDSADISAVGLKKTDSNGPNGIHITSTADTKITSSAISTTNADINITAGGNVALNTKADSHVDIGSTLVTAYDSGNVTVQGKNVSLNSGQLNQHVSVGSRNGTTTVKTTEGDLTISASGGGSASVGYLYHDFDERIAGLELNNSDGKYYFARGNINVNSARDVILNSSYTPSGNRPAYYPAAMIGHSLLPAENLLLTGVNPDFYVGGNIDVRTNRDVRISSTGSSLSQIGHYLQGNISGTGNTMAARRVAGDINVDSFRDIVIQSDNVSQSAIGHSADYMALVYDVNDPNPKYHTIMTAASRDIILNAGGSSTSRIGDSILSNTLQLQGQAPLMSGGYESVAMGNIQSLSGRNLTMGGNGKTVIGHTNKVHDGLYNSTVIIGYSLNRLSEITQDCIVSNLSPDMVASLNALKARFNGKEEGSFTMGSNSRVGREMRDLEAGPNYWHNYVGIFGWRMMKNNRTSAIRLANGAVLAGVKIDSNSPPGQYQGDYLYSLGPWPGKGEGLGLRYAFEYYGYILPDYETGHLAGLLPELISAGGFGKIPELGLHIFYPISFKDTPPPPPYHPPYWPMFPAWFECCCCCCCVETTTCEEYIPGPCENSCCDPNGAAPYGNGNGDGNGNGVGSPTLAPQRPEPSAMRGVSPQPITISLLNGQRS